MDNTNQQQQFLHHYNYQSNHQQQQQSLKKNLTSEENTNLDAFLESSQFLTDPYIKSLIDKGITLGIVWEVIKETLCRFLLNSINSSMSEFDMNGINYSRLIDEEKFFEQLILYSIQVENSNNGNKHSMNKNNTNDDDYNENEEDDYESIATNDTASVVEHVINTDHDFDLGNQFSRINIDNKVINRPTISSNLNTMAAAINANKKILPQPLTAQQKLQQEQDFITQSINRINDKSNLRPIIVDSNDVALSSHSNKQVFMFSRIKQVVDYFEKRNHQIFVILSSWRKEQIMSIPMSQNNNSATSSSSSIINSQQQQTSNQQQQQQPLNTQLTPDQLALIEMEQKNQVYYTPSKRVGAKRIVCDDDSYMLKLAVAKMAIIVSNDNFKRFLNHSEDFKLVIEERVLMYSFIDSTFMPAEDPLGKNGPSLDNFLRFESFVNQQYMKRCPYRKKCTYGSKCKFWHPERGLHQGNQLFKTAHQSVLDEAQEQKMRLEIILNKNSFTAQKPINQQNIYSIDNDENDEDEFRLQSEEAKLFNKLKQQKQQYSGLVSSSNIYNLHEFDNMKSNEQTWSLNKADSVMNQHIQQQYQKINLFSDKLQDSSRLIELRAMGPDTQLKMSSMNNSNKNLQQKIKNNYNQNSSCYTPNLIWDMKPSTATNKTKNDFDFENLNHQTGAQHFNDNHQNQQQQQQIIKNKLNENKFTDLSEAFSLFAQSSQATATQSSTPTSVSPPLMANSLRAQLIATNLNPRLVDDVLNKYKGETDIEKLIFFARGISFDF